MTGVQTCALPISEALAELMESRSRDDSELTGATEKLREAIGLEERH